MIIHCTVSGQERCYILDKLLVYHRASHNRDITIEIHSHSHLQTIQRKKKNSQAYNKNVRGHENTALEEGNQTHDLPTLGDNGDQDVPIFHFCGDVMWVVTSNYVRIRLAFVVVFFVFFSLGGQVTFGVALNVTVLGHSQKDLYVYGMYLFLPIQWEWKGWKWFGFSFAWSSSSLDLVS